MNAAEERDGYRVPGAGYGLRTAATRLLRSVALVYAVGLAACAPQPQERPAAVATSCRQRARAGRRRDEGRSTSREPATRGTTSLGQMECRPAARRAPWWAHPREARRAHRRAVAGAVAPRIDLRSVDVPRRRDRRARRHAARSTRTRRECRRGSAAARQSRTLRSITGLGTDCRPGASSNAATRRRTKRVVPSSCCGGATMAGMC